jgi:hypothetical protein
MKLKPGPRSAGRSWTPEEDRELEEPHAYGLKSELIRQKLKRSTQAVRKRISF